MDVSLRHLYRIFLDSFMQAKSKEIVLKLAAGVEVSIGTNSMKTSVLKGFFWVWGIRQITIKVKSK